MGHATHRDLKQVVDLLGTLSAQSTPAGLAEEGVRLLPGLVASEVTTLSVCTLKTGRRRVTCNPAGAISTRDIATFDRFFYDHPLVRYHASHPDGTSHRISDSMSQQAFRKTPVYNEYYRRVGFDQAIAVPLFVDSSLLVSFVLNRSRMDFSERDREVLDLLRRPLAALYRNALALQQAQRPIEPAIIHDVDAALTAREREIIRWVALGKTNAQIGAILDASPRTIGKHLENIYAKLGVETRTAAVNRALSGHRL